MMKSIVLAVLLCAAVASCSHSEAEYKDAFGSWMSTFNKVYSSSEFQTRYTIFKQNMDFVQSWNADKTNTHTVELNSLADLSNKEYRQFYLGTRINHKAGKYVPSVTADTVNWVAKGAVTAIKNQGQCGSCWAFSTTGSTEGITFLKTGKLVSLSEQNLVDCSAAEGNLGCNGGLMDQGFEYIIKNGIDTEASYPYTAVQGKCRFNKTNVATTLTGYTDVPAGSEAGLTAAITKQPVSVAIDASHTSFQLYKTGVYYEKACSTSQLDHGVLAVGYGADTTNTAYYIVKNSWGTTWGQAGYIWMSRNKSNNCGIATSASTPVNNGSTTTGQTTTSSGPSTSTNTATSNTASSNTASSNTASSNTASSNTASSGQITTTSGTSSSGQTASASSSSGQTSSSGETSSSSNGETSSSSSGQTSSSSGQTSSSSGQTSASSGQTSASSGQTSATSAASSGQSSASVATATNGQTATSGKTTGTAASGAVYPKN